MPELFAEAKDRDSAAAAAQERLDEIRAIVTDEIARQGYDYTCDAQIVDMYFNTREYDDFAMPAGNYRALRVTIGAAEGKNWWCVMFPPLCLPSSIVPSLQSIRHGNRASPGEYRYTRASPMETS